MVGNIINSSHMSKPANCFILYCKDHRQYLQKEHSELSNSEISSLLGKEWRGMTFEEKRPYVEQANILKTVSTFLHSITLLLIKIQQFVPVQKRDKSENMFNFKLTKTIIKESKLKAIPEQKSMISEQKLNSPIVRKWEIPLCKPYPQYCAENEFHEYSNMSSTIVTTLRYKTRSMYAPVYFPSLNHDF